MIVGKIEAIATIAAVGVIGYVAYQFLTRKPEEIGRDIVNTVGAVGKGSADALYSFGFEAGQEHRRQIRAATGYYPEEIISFKPLTDWWASVSQNWS